MRLAARAESTARRRREILDAALRCFLDEGYSATTMERLRVRSGASTGSIYHQFSSKEEVATALFLEAYESVMDQALTALTRSSTGMAGVRSFVFAHLDW